jgi:hypothetical protein
MALIGCTAKPKPGVEPITTGTADELFAGLAAPLAVQSFSVSTSEGRRGVFLKLSRIPERVTSHDESEPARIVIDAEGPAEGADMPVQTFAGGDTLVSQLHVSRTGGDLRMVLELSSVEVPLYSVHQMADWVMVRFVSKGAP